MDSNGLSAGDILALTKNNGNDMMGGGAGFWWVIVFLIVAGMFNGGGLFGNNRGAENAVLGSDEFIKRDIFNTNQNVSNTACTTQRDVLENRYTTQLGMQSLQAQNQACCCETQKEIIESRYNSALGQAGIQKDIMQSRYDNTLGQSNIQRDILLNGRDLQAQLASCCCDLKTAIHAEGEATRSMIQEDKIQQLRDQVFTTNLALNNANLASNIVNQVRPFPQPAYITASPYQSYNCGCNGYGYGYGVSSVI